LTYLVGNHENKLEQLKHELEMETHGLDMEQSRKRITLTRGERGTFEKIGQKQKLPSIKGHKHDTKHNGSLAIIESQDINLRQYSCASMSLRFMKPSNIHNHGFLSPSLIYITNLHIQL
jgi:hypothetical protein